MSIFVASPWIGPQNDMFLEYKHRTSLMFVSRVVNFSLNLDVKCKYSIQNRYAEYKFKIEQ